MTVGALMERMTAAEYRGWLGLFHIRGKEAEARERAARRKA